jgi:hypothetical protein
MEHEYVLPAGFSRATLTTELLGYLAGSDTELREGPAYLILSQWIDQPATYSHAERWDMATHLLHNLTIGLGEQQTDTIFLRSFSTLILVELIYHDLSEPIFSDQEVRRFFEEVLAYFAAEQDLRGYVPEKGWAHAIAHSADCFWLLARHRAIAAAELERMLEAIAEKLTAPVAHVYLADEDERLVRAVMAALQRDLLSLSFLEGWLERFSHPKGRIGWDETFEQGRLMEVAHSPRETCARHNSKHFLRSLFFQLRSPGFAGMPQMGQRPAVAEALLPAVEHALAQIRAWN